MENKPGAGGMVAAIDVFHKIDSKGYDLLVCTYNDAVNTVLYKSAKHTLSDMQQIFDLALQLSDRCRQVPSRVQYSRAHQLYKSPP